MIHGDLAAFHGIERNGAYRIFMNPRIRQTLVDWETHAERYRELNESPRARMRAVQKTP